MIRIRFPVKGVAVAVAVAVEVVAAVIELRVLQIIILCICNRIAATAYWKCAIHAPSACRAIPTNFSCPYTHPLLHSLPPSLGQESCRARPACLFICFHYFCPLCVYVTHNLKLAAYKPDTRRPMCTIATSSFVIVLLHLHFHLHL